MFWWIFKINEIVYLFIDLFKNFIWSEYGGFFITFIEEFRGAELLYLD